MIDMGVKIGFGSDAGCAFDNHGDQGFEFELMTRYGFSPAGALLSATKVNSELLKLQNQIGTIQPGKWQILLDLIKIHWKYFCYDRVCICYERWRSLQIMK